MAERKICEIHPLTIWKKPHEFVKSVARKKRKFRQSEEIKYREIRQSVSGKSAKIVIQLSEKIAKFANRSSEKNREINSSVGCFEILWNSSIGRGKNREIRQLILRKNQEILLLVAEKKVKLVDRLRGKKSRNSSVNCRKNAKLVDSLRGKIAQFVSQYGGKSRNSIGSGKISRNSTDKKSTWMPFLRTVCELFS